MQLVAIPLSLVNSIIPPTIAELHAQGHKQKLERVLRFTATVVVLPALAVITLLIIFAGDVLKIIFGDFYSTGAPVVVIMAIGQLVNLITGSPGVLLAMSDRQNSLHASQSYRWNDRCVHERLVYYKIRSNRCGHRVCSWIVNSEHHYGSFMLAWFRH